MSRKGLERPVRDIWVRPSYHLGLWFERHVGNMIRVNNYRFYFLGTLVHPLAEYDQNTTAGPMRFFEIKMARDALESVKQQELVPLHFSTKAIDALIKAIDDAWPKDGQFSDDAVLGHQGWNISYHARSFETLFATELENLDTYFVSKKGIFSTTELIERAENVLPGSVISKLPPECITDLRQAGRCLAFECPTAAGFHIFRAVETVMKKYLLSIGGTLKQNWGALIIEMEAQNASKEITSALRQMKDLHRNPVMHPEEFLTNDEATSSLMIGQSVIVAMATSPKF